MAPVVLIVEDEPDIRSSLRLYLSMHLPGVEVMEAADAEEALAIARRRPVDLVLTDYVMPGKDGLEMLAEWDHVQPDTKRILLTAYPDADVAIRAVRRHRATVLAKPAEPWRIAVEVATRLGMQAMPPWTAGEGVAA